MDFPARLREVRKKRKMTQEQLGKRVDVTKVSISCYENGSRTPDIDTLEKIADALDVSVDYLLGRTDEVELVEEDEGCRWFKEVLRAPEECREIAEARPESITIMARSGVSSAAR